jgi:hypothetical protein
MQADAQWGEKLTSKTFQFSLAADPRAWGSDLSPDLVENDDALHNPESEPALAQNLDTKEILRNKRGLVNVGCILTLFAMIIFLLLVLPLFPRHCTEAWRQYWLSSDHVCDPYKPNEVRLQLGGNQFYWAGGSIQNSAEDIGMTRCWILGARHWELWSHRPRYTRRGIYQTLRARWLKNGPGLLRRI